MLEWRTEAGAAGRPTVGRQRIYIPMGGAGFLFQAELGQNPELVLSLQGRETLATSGIATCVGLILYHEASNSGMLAHLMSDNESKGLHPAAAICPEMIEKFVRKVDCRSGDLQAYICYREDVEPTESTQDIVKQLKTVFEPIGVNYQLCLDRALHRGFPGTDIYLNFRTREAGIYDERFKKSEEIGESRADDVTSACFKTFPDTDHFEYYILESPLRIIPSATYLPTAGAVAAGAGRADDPPDDHAAGAGFAPGM